MMRPAIDPVPVSSRRGFLRGALLALPGFMLAGLVPEAEAAATPSLLTRLGVIRRTEWAHTPSRPRRLHRASAFTRLTIHHAGNGIVRTTRESAVRRELQGMLDAHLKLNYGDLGYHFVVDYAGRVWEGRPLLYEGAHVGCANSRNIGVVVMGNFERQQPSADQLRGLDSLVSGLRAHYRFSRGRIYGHRDLGQSLCPGRHLYGFTQRLRTGRA